MLMSVTDIARNAGVYPELAGSRVMITGIGPTHGVDIVRAFAEHGCQLVLQIPDPCPETDALLTLIADSALDIHAHHSPIDTADNALVFTQTASKIYGGLDAAINLIAFDGSDLANAASLADVEDVISARMNAAARATGVAANRMGLTWTPGSIMNILHVPAAHTGTQSMVAGIARATLAALTQMEAQKWAAHGVRVNAIAPSTSLPGLSTLDSDEPLQSEAECASLALYLASSEGEAMTGHIFDMETQAIAA